MAFQPLDRDDTPTRLTRDDTPTPLTRDGIAARIARDIPEGWFVNLGIGIPTRVSDFVPGDREVIFHAENGVIGIGPAPAGDAWSGS